MHQNTGVIGDRKINCHLANENRTASLKNIIDGEFDHVSFKRTNQVTPNKNFMWTVKIHDMEVSDNLVIISHEISFYKLSGEK